VRFLRSPLLLALAVTLANAAKPVVVDDAAYVAFARHIATNPLDPYGFTIFWYTVPDPAFEVLAPPVVPYWLAAGIRVFGDRPALLKLWLLPFVWLLAWAVNDLLRRFARSTRLLPLIVLSPAVLPAVNLMLDVPALALGLAGVAVFARAADRESWRLAVVAGLLAALAMQTKYTMLLIPPVVAWYALTHRRIVLAVIAIVVATAAFASWELILVQKYGRSHFLYHAASQREVEPESRLEFFLAKLDLLGPMLSYLGCLAIGAGLVAAGSLGVSRRWLRVVAVLWVAGFVAVALVPYRWTMIDPETEFSAALLFWEFFGGLTLGAFLGCAAVLLFRCRKRFAVRRNPTAVFLAGWLLIELAGYFALTPFPAARRVFGLAVVGGILTAATASRLGRIRRSRRTPRWLLAFGIAAGVAVAAIDTFDAYAEKVCAEEAAAATAGRPASSRVWFAGHWGFQFYCERAGMRPVVPGESVLAPGDFLVLPVHPGNDRFYRPHIGAVPIEPNWWVAEPVAEFVWDDWLSAQTVPNFYGGYVPVVGRDHPRLRVVVYRVRGEWHVPGR
jgi:hypothetical protein